MGNFMVEEKAFIRRKDKSSRRRRWWWKYDKSYY